MALLLSRGALKALRSMPKAEAAGLMERLGAIAAEPAGRHPSVVAMQGRPGAFRVRQGEWRAVFVIDGADVRVDRIGHRREVYR